ncbi:hypothetical protein HHI36_005921 [Cryptolaemus montrouzieri]|uniref:Uncharacterized protein n=1 Tax=Cryptolaemus montrouzieri TaxID=559131 RepID=A0ABD2NVR7_9CUCU
MSQEERQTFVSDLTFGCIVSECKGFNQAKTTASCGVDSVYSAHSHRFYNYLRSHPEAVDFLENPEIGTQITKSIEKCLMGEKRAVNLN